MKELLKGKFPKITKTQLDQLMVLPDLYKEWNDKINVISRKDIDAVFDHHILHSLSIAMKFSFVEGSKVLDLGTGGGLPGIPLAILFPEVYFKLIDGTAKKIRVVNDIIERLGLKNVVGQQMRAEELREQFDFVVTRAVAKIDKLKEWSLPLIKDAQQHAIPNGLIALKGGNIKEELALLSKRDYYELTSLVPLLDLPYYDEKYMVYLQL